MNPILLLALIATTSGWIYFGPLLVAIGSIAMISSTFLTLDKSQLTKPENIAYYSFSATSLVIHSIYMATQQTGTTPELISHIVPWLGRANMLFALWMIARSVPQYKDNLNINSAILASATSIFMLNAITQWNSISQITQIIAISTIAFGVQLTINNIVKPSISEIPIAPTVDTAIEGSTYEKTTKQYQPLTNTE